MRHCVDVLRQCEPDIDASIDREASKESHGWLYICWTQNDVHSKEVGRKEVDNEGRGLQVEVYSLVYKVASSAFLEPSRWRECH